MIKQLFSSALLIATLGACCATKPPSAPVAKEVTTLAVSPEIVYHGDTEFTPEERSDIEWVASAWGTQTGGLARISIIWDLDFRGPVTELQKQVDHHLILRGDTSHPGWEPGMLGVAPPLGGIHRGLPVRLFLFWEPIQEGELQYPGYRKTVVMHEMGHNLGLTHLEASPHALMFPGLRVAKPCLTQADLSEFCRVNSCGHVKMIACTRNDD